ncbi:MAG: hypothetical protein AAF703_02490 [Cyanobacteria bacterium P01_D01_bin.105]
MSLEGLYTEILAYRIPIMLLLFGSPWVTYLSCVLIPGKKEEPFLLSVNLALTTLSIVMLLGYLAYATNTGGWTSVVQQADVLLLMLPIYHAGVSLYLSRLRLPLQAIPAFRTMQGLMMMSGALLALSWMLERIRIVLFSYLPFGTFLGVIAIVLAIGYAGYRKLLD